MGQGIIKHDNAISSWITLCIDRDGVTTTVLMIETDLSLNAEDPNYRKDAVDSLAAAAVAGLFYKDVRLGLVLGAAMVTNMILASIAGTLIPVGLKKVRIDPAVASSVFVTTCSVVASKPSSGSREYEL